MIKFDYTNLLADSIGEEHGLKISEIEAMEDEVLRVDEWLNGLKDSGKIGYAELPYNKESVKQVKEVAAKIRNEFENFVLLGIGGSALGPISLHTSLNSLYYNDDNEAKRNGGPRMFFCDNVDPEFFGDLLDRLDLSKTCFSVVTKSGGTAETIASFAIVYEMIERKIGKSILSKNFVAVTDAQKGLLKKISTSLNLTTLDVPANVGGRFSVFCPVGLLPAAVEGIDIDQMLDGAADMDQKCRTTDIFKNPAYLNAVLHYLLYTKKNKTISVMMPYSNALRNFADWYCQLWAESLGKRFAVDGSKIEVGQTPVKALGATDQHSQIQLYNEGPNDKIITFLEVQKFRKKLPIPVLGGDFAEADYLGNHDMADLLNAELLATESAVSKYNRPNCKVIFDEITPYNIGQFIFMYEESTAFAGGLYNINPFDQPGVEDGKIATYALMGRKGFEDKKPVVNKDRKVV